MRRMGRESQWMVGRDREGERAGNISWWLCWGKGSGRMVNGVGGGGKKRGSDWVCVRDAPSTRQ